MNKKIKQLKQDIPIMDNENISDQQSLNSLSNFYELSEKDFYPPEDKRTYDSNIRDIKGGDSYDEYVKWFFETYEEELFDN